MVIGSAVQRGTWDYVYDEAGGSSVQYMQAATRRTAYEVILALRSALGGAVGFIPTMKKASRFPPFMPVSMTGPYEGISGSNARPLNAGFFQFDIRS